MKHRAFTRTGTCVLALFLICGVAEGAFRDDFLGARPLAMGGAYTALSNDADGILINPAGLTTLKGHQLFATTSALYVGLSDGSRLTQNILGYSRRQKEIGSLGIVWKNFSVRNLYSENVLSISYTRRSRLYLTKGDKDRPRNLSIGSALKLMEWNSAPTMDDHGRIVEELPRWQGISLDVGLVIWTSENTPVAVSFQNMIKPNVTSNRSAIKESLKGVTRMGVAIISQDTIWVLDMVLTEGLIDLHTGLERRLQSERIFIRAGFDLRNLAWGLNFSAGFGYKVTDSARIDYAFVYPVNTIFDTFGSHRISVVYDFGQ